mmetsp:Transcript_3188/g.7374  ORF Transcript_3188/g.7374 Transcript_3188/m.7374 type:complete len:289 (-) Transcript_3188:357-1223(-)
MRLLCRRKDGAILPKEGSQELSEEEKKIEVEQFRIKEAKKYLNQGHMGKLCKVLKVNSGLLPGVICQALPNAIRSLAPTIFGDPSDKPLKGLPAACLRVLEINTAQIRKIRRCFEDMDEDKSGVISLVEFADYFAAEDNNKTRRMIKSTLFHNKFQTNGTKGGLFDFGGFVVSTCLICTYTDDQILWRVFKFFDTDDSGYLEHSQLVQLGKAMQSMASTDNADAFLQAMDSNKNGVVDFDEFVSYSRKHPTAFWPVMKIQNLLRKRTLSVESWLILIEAWNSQVSLFT